MYVDLYVRCFVFRFVWGIFVAIRHVFGGSTFRQLDRFYRHYRVGPTLPALLHPHTQLLATAARAPLLRTSLVHTRAHHQAPSARAPSTRAHARASGKTVKIRPICNSSLILKFPFTPRIYFTTQSDCEVSSKVTVLGRPRVSLIDSTTVE